MNTEEIIKVLDALETGRDAAHEVAQRFHEEMKGYREAEHKQVDEDVSVIEEAINIVKAERTTSPVSQMTAHLAAIEEALKVMRDNGLDECYAFENAIEALAFMKEVAK